MSRRARARRDKRAPIPDFDEHQPASSGLFHFWSTCVVLHSIEICAGVGMLGEGARAAFELLGIEHRTVCYVEREAPAAAQLARLMEAGALDPAPIWSDLLTFDGTAWRGCVDLLIAGFPCQDISIAGRRAGLDGKRSGLFFDIHDIADDCDAQGLFLENVSAIATATASAVDEAEGDLEERAAARVVGELADRGWDAEWITLSASDVGASHGRARWFCLAWRRAMGHAGLHARGAQHGQQPQGPTGGLGQPGADGDSGNVADAGHRARTHEPIGIAGSGGPANDSPGGQAVGNTERPRWPQAGRGPEIDTGRKPEPRRGDMDDAQRVELAGQRIHPRSRPSGDGTADSDGAGAAVAHAGQPGLPHAEQPEPAGAWTGHERRAAAELRGAPLFAPGPLDPRWAAIVANRPDLAPAVEPGVCLLADGMAYLVDESRAHQLRQVGNGVVPLQAAVALVELVRRAASK